VRSYAAIATLCLQLAALVFAASGAEKTHSIRETSLSFTNGDIVLRGTLMSPDPPTRHPTLVLVHGSGAADRKGFVFARALAEAGIPVFAYDKRGVGESGGDWKKSSIAELASDSVTAVNHLKAREPNALIGLWGGSQGGWIVPMAATLSTNVAFIISVSGAGMSPGEQMLYCQDNQWREARLSENNREQLHLAWKSFYDYISTGQGATALDANVGNLEKVKSLDDRRPLKSSELAAEPFFQKFGYGFDPLPYWRKVKCPVLAIWGERDTMVPAKRSAELIEGALRSAGNTNYVIKSFPKARHGIDLPGKQRLPEGWVDWQFAPGYIELMSRWIKERSMRSAEEAVN
jgi:uncharacterized protein